MWRDIISVEMPVGKLKPNKIPERLWQHISVDFITKLLVSKGHDLILLVCNRFSKMSHFVAITEKKTTEELVRLFRDNIYVVATTRQNGTRSLLTSAKLSDGYLVVGITRELNKKPLLHCSSIYINYMWSVLQ